MFLLIDEIDIASYADDNTPYATGHCPIVINKLEAACKKLFEWFKNNGMKANPTKCNFLSSLEEKTQICLEKCSIKTSASQKLLGITIDKKLTFNEHVSKLCDKASMKINALARICPFMPHEQRKILMNAYFLSQFGYCPLVWMNHSREMNNRINHLHERTLRIVYEDYQSSFQQLLDKDKSVTIHQRNLRILAFEIYKTKNNLSPNIMNEIFKWKQPHYCLRNNDSLLSRNVKSVLYGTESITALAPKIWNLLPADIKNSQSSHQFKEKIRTWSTNKCPCRLCKRYIQNVGFI